MCMVGGWGEREDEGDGLALVANKGRTAKATEVNPVKNKMKNEGKYFGVMNTFTSAD